MAVREELERVLAENVCSSVAEVVEEVSRSLGVPKGLVAYELFMMWKRGEVELEGAPRSAIAYIFSIESAWYWLSIALVAASVFAVTLVTEPPLIYVRYILGALMLLFLPGYAVVETLYPRGDELSPLERLALAIGFSLAVLPLIGLALNYTPWGIGLGPVLISTNALTIALLTTALIRKVKIFRMRAHSYPYFCS